MEADLDYDYDYVPDILTKEADIILHDDNVTIGMANAPPITDPDRSALKLEFSFYFSLDIK